VDQTTQQNLITAFNTVVRTSALAGKIDQQRTSLAFAAMLQNLPGDGRVVPLVPVYEFLLQQRAPEHAVREVLVYLKSREGRLGVTLQLPRELESMSEEERGRLLMAVAARGQTGGTFPGVSRTAAEPEPPPPAEKPAPTTGFVPPKKTQTGAGAGGGPPRALIVALVLCVVGLGGSVAYNQLTKQPGLPQLAINDPNGLPCVELLDAPSAFLCFVHDDFLAATPKDALKTRAETTRATAVARGFAHRPVQVLSFEQRALRHMFP
jgi:hypothetical protein